MTPDVSMDGQPTIPEFYKGKSIFITGGSGFLGKVLIEKLLWSCSDLERIYILLRPKKGKLGIQRLEDLGKSKLFDRLRNRDGEDFLKKVSCVSGDVTQLGLGLSTEERKILIDTVNVIFHSAASVRFDDPLRDAVLMNTRGSRELMYLAKEMKTLDVMIHVSTTYCNTDKNPVEEMLYPPHSDWKDAISIAENADDHTLRILTPKFIDTLPNTYTFTKSLAEHVINDLRGNISAVIFRPSIVVSSLSEPVPGWIENFNGPVGLLVASGKGVMRSIFSGSDIKADYMPVDIAIKAMIVASWKHGLLKSTSADPIPVYNCCASTLKDVTMQEIIDMGMGLTREIPLNGILWTPGGGITKYRSYHYIRVILYHLLPAIFLDFMLKFIGQKAMLVKLQRRIYIANMALHYYITNQWTFKNEQLVKLRSTIKREDKGGFSYDFEVEDVYIFFKNCLIGGRRYLLNEPDDTIPQALVHFNRMFILDKIVKLTLWGFIFWWIFNSKFIEGIVFSLLSIFHLV